MDKDEPPLTREDFESQDDWLRHCRQGGLDPFDLSEFRGLVGSSRDTALASAIYGDTERAYQRSWEGWGESEYLNFEDLQKGFRALAFANCRGRVLSTRLDITWSTVGADSDITVAHRQGKFLDWMRRWLTRNANGADFFWVLERGPKFGLHSHILCCLPEIGLGKAFKAAAETNLQRIVNKPLLKTDQSSTMKIQPRSAGMADVGTQWERFRYMMKGLHPHEGWEDPHEVSGVYSFAERARISPEYGGVVAVKRMGVSRSLDDASFRRWAAINHFPDMEITRWGAGIYDERYLDWYRQNVETLKVPEETINGNQIRETETDNPEETDIDDWIAEQRQ